MQEDQGFGSLKSLRPDRILGCFAYILQMGCYRLSGISIHHSGTSCKWVVTGSLESAFTVQEPITYYKTSPLDIAVKRAMALELLP
uniref:Uncharacterized protein n=1 Tax=Oryza rufipogon TaxID=4529 RepID=A0A0E0PJH8_ORYRU